MKNYVRLSAVILFFMVVLSGCSEDNPTVPPTEHFEPEGWLIRDETQKPVLVVWEGTLQSSWNGIQLSDTLTAPLNSLSEHYSVKFLDINRNVMNPPSDEDHQFGWLITDTSLLEVVQDAPTDWAFHLKGLQTGATTLELNILHAGHVDVRTPKIPVVIEANPSAPASLPDTKKSK